MAVAELRRGRWNGARSMQRDRIVFHVQPIPLQRDAAFT
jgi:hypothetical protein